MSASLAKPLKPLTDEEWLAKCRVSKRGEHFGPPRARVYSNIDKNAAGGCWAWTGHKIAKGYGRTSWGDRDVLAHRLVWLLEVGSDADGLLCHTCDNPCCVNPAHLFVGTVRDNAIDAAAKGRLMHGERHTSATATEQQIREAHALWLGGKATTEAAASVGLSYNQLHAVLTGRTWKHLRLPLVRS